MTKLDRAQRIAATFALLFGVATQISMTVQIGATPLRVVAGDLLLIVALPVLVLVWLTSGRPAIATVEPRLALWLGGLTCVIAGSILVGRIATEQWIVWGIVNRGIGWLVLMGFLICGVLIAKLGNIYARRWFVASFAATAAVAAVLTSSKVIYCISGADCGVGGYARATGFIENPNSFGIICAVAVLMLAVLMSRGASVLPGPLSHLAFGCAGIGVVLSQSRSAWLAVAVGSAIGLFRKSLKVERLLAGLAIVALGILMFRELDAIVDALRWTSGLVAGEDSSLYKRLSAAREVIPGQQVVGKISIDSGVSHRLEVNRRAIELWKESPIFGIGLGAFYQAQLDQHGTVYGSAIHTTALWLLTETGLVGLGMFAGFFVCIFGGLIREASVENEFADASIVALVALAAASVGTEILFQRYLWLIIGLAAVSRRHHPA